MVFRAICAPNMQYCMNRFAVYILILCPFIAPAQKEDYNWIMGVGQADLPGIIYRLNHFQFYNDTFHVEALNKSIPFWGACAIVSDSAGNLLCYTNGIHLYNRFHSVMPNGANFQSSVQFPYGYPFNQTVLLLPLPYSDSLLIMVDGIYKDIGIDIVLERLRFSIINMRLLNGYGAVNQKNSPIENTTDTLNLGFLTAVRHVNGKDWWLLTTKFESNRYRKFLISKDGIKYHDDQIIGDTVHNGPGYAVFSPSGCWYARFLTHGQAANPAGELYIYRFDRSTGQLSEPLHRPFPKPEYFGGVAISPNSRYLYLAKFLQIFQYDLHAPDILASETVVAEFDGFLDENGVPTRFYGLQLAPDHKIYGNVPGFNSRYLHVIDQPDLPGPACNVIQHAIYLPAHNFGTLPNLPYYRLYEATISCDSLISGVQPPVRSATTVDLRVWPVPAADVLHFSATPALEQPLQLLLFDGLGRLAYERQGILLMPTTSISLENLPPGVYFYSLVQKNGRVVKSGRVIRTR